MAASNDRLYVGNTFLNKQVLNDRCTFDQIEMREKNLKQDAILVSYFFIRKTYYFITLHYILSVKKRAISHRTRHKLIHLLILLGAAVNVNHCNLCHDALNGIHRHTLVLV